MANQNSKLVRKGKIYIFGGHIKNTDIGAGDEKAE